MTSAARCGSGIGKGPVRSQPRRRRQEKILAAHPVSVPPLPPRHDAAHELVEQRDGRTDPCRGLRRGFQQHLEISFTNQHLTQVDLIPRSAV